MTDKKKLSLSRRQALGGLGAIGLAGAGAGLGTSALFSDEESFENNSITAGTMDMEVTGEMVAANDEYISAVTDITGNPITADGAVETGFQVQDFKPGDWFILCLTVDSVAENPFYLTLHSDDLVEFGGANPEPEGSNEANLGDKILTSIWGSYDDSGTKSGLTGLDSTTNTASTTVLASQSYLEPNENGSTGNSNVSYTDVREWHSGYGNFNGYASGDGVLVGGNSPAEIGSDPSSSDLLTDPDGDSEGELVFYMLFELPGEVGNEIQGDTLSGNLRFNAEQVRNNSDPRSGRGDAGDLFVADGSVQSDATGGIREADSWITAGVSNATGPKTIVRVELDGDVYGGGNSGLGEWPSNENVYFMEANVDVDNDGIDEAANDDDFRVGYAAANSGARANAISNSSSGASGAGGYIRRNTGGSSSGDSPNRSDVAEEDVPGFTAYESADQLTYVFELDWSQIAGDSSSPTAQLGSAPGAIQINEVFGGDGGEGVGATPNSSNDGRGSIDNTTDSSGTFTL
jgi:predicted ribosomally synthesized peptide with SipW-like signal peptide